MCSRRTSVVVIVVALIAACTFSTKVPEAVQDALPDAGVCVAQSRECLGDTFRECSGQGAIAVDKSCGWGCKDFPLAHCGEIDPAGGGVRPEDVKPDDVIAVSLDAGITIDGDTGRIGTNVNPTLVRGANPGIVNGIFYEQRANNISVFRFKSLTIKLTPTTNVPALTLTGTRAIALVADEDIIIEGIVDARGSCTGTNPGPGGLVGGAKDSVVAATRSGASTNISRFGGGGGGHAGAGGVGRGNIAGGMIFGDPQITLLGGGGGGGGGGGNAEAGNGGGGGGAIQLVSNGRIVIKDTGGINAGGCGGETGRGGDDGGGGGGAGGTILLEARTVIVDGTLAVNGGGGGGGDAEPDATEAPGESGRLDLIGARGFPGPNAAGGNGASNSTFDGAAGLLALDDGGGGGGAIGRIRINTQSGTVMVGVSAALSPPPSAVPMMFGVAKVR